MEVGTFAFGKHRGLPSCDVPIDYLAWAMERHARPHQCVLDELRRRAASQGSRDAVAAQAAIGGWDYRRAKSSAKKARQKASRPAGVRQEPSKGGEFVGADYAASMSKWLASGGDVRECPF